MSNYGFRDNALTAEEIEGTKITGKTVVGAKGNDSKAVTYIKLQTNAVGTVGMPDGYAYLYVGSAGALMLSSVAPTGTTLAFENAGAIVKGSVA